MFPALFGELPTPLWVGITSFIGQLVLIYDKAKTFEREIIIVPTL